MAARSNKKRSVWAKVLPMLGLPNAIKPRGLSMISGSIDPSARKARSALLIKRAVARVRPRWAKRSIEQRSIARVYNYLVG